MHTFSRGAEPLHRDNSIYLSTAWVGARMVMATRSAASGWAFRVESRWRWWLAWAVCMRVGHAPYHQTTP